MGEALVESFGDEVYAVGVFAGGGSFANNSRKPVTMAAPTESDDVRHVIEKLGQPATFIDLSAEESPGREWLFEEVAVNDTFLDLEGGNKLVLG
jgi:hypothetical protein